MYRYIPGIVLRSFACNIIVPTDPDDRGESFLLLCRNGTLDFTITKFYADSVFLALICLPSNYLK